MMLRPVAAGPTEIASLHSLPTWVQPIRARGSFLGRLTDADRPAEKRGCSPADRGGLREGIAKGMREGLRRLDAPDRGSVRGLHPRPCSSGSLREIVDDLLPGTRPYPHNQVFFETESPWALFIEDGACGTDAHCLRVLSEKMQTEAIRAVLSPGGDVTPWPAVMFEHYRCGAVTRSIAAANDGGRWVWYASGTPLTVENVTNYDKRVIRTRFTPNGLLEVLSFFGIVPNAPGFYRSHYCRCARAPSMSPGAATGVELA